jgi:hypothetical protein
MPASSGIRGKYCMLGAGRKIHCFIHECSYLVKVRCILDNALVSDHCHQRVKLKVIAVTDIYCSIGFLPTFHSFRI